MRRRGSYRPLLLFACLSVILLTSFVSGVSAEPAYLIERRNLVFDHLGTGDGLSHANVSVVIQDRTGFIWIGTVEGLNRYDGRHIETFYNEESNASSLSNDSVWDLIEDSKGALWVATDNGLNRYDSQRKSFEKFYPSESEIPELGRAHNIVRSLYEDTGGRIWVGTELGLCELRSDGSFAHYHHSPQDLDSLSQGAVRTILEDSSGRFWVGTDRGGLNLFDRETGKATRFKNEAGNVNSLVNNAVQDLAEDSQGRIWVATEGGISILGQELGKLHRVIPEPDDPNGLSSGEIKSLLVDQSGDLWVGTFGGGLNLWQEEQKSFRVFMKDPTSPRSLKNNDVQALYQDRGGVIWVGSQAGVSKWNAEVPSFPHFKNDPVNGFNLPGNSVTYFEQDGDGNVWIATVAGLAKWDIKKGVIDGYPGEALNIKNRVMSLVTDDKDRLWVGTFIDGVHVFENGKKVAEFREQFFDYSRNRVFGVTGIYKDSQGRIWISTYKGGIFRYLGEDRFAHYSTRGSGKAIDLVEGDNGIIWVAVDGGGVQIIDPETGEIQSINHDPDDRQSLSSDSVIELLKTEDSIWAGTRNDGLNRIRLDTMEITRYNKNDGLASDVIYGLLEDSEGKIWVSGGKGLSVLDVSTSEIIRYDSDHGLQGEDFHSRACLKLRDGTLLFGGTNGFNAFDPLVNRVNKYLPEIRITRISKFNKSSRSFVPITEESILELNYDDYVVGFEFAAFDYSAPEKNRYQYILEGFDQRWIDSGDVRQVTYTNLNPGRYVFRVKGSNNDGVWNNTGASLNVIVRPPIWATWWAYGFYILIAMLALYWLQQANAERSRRDAERRYNRRLQLYIQSLEEATDCVLIADQNKKLLYANSAISAVLGMEPSMALGRPLMELLFPHGDEVAEALRGLDVDGRWDGEVNHVKGEGRFIAEVSLSSVRDTNNEVVAYVSILRDISDRKRTEAELENHRRNLEFLVEERTSALSREIASHKEAQHELARSLEEKEMLLKEVHHRVKNNMQVISSLLNIQAETIGSEFFSGLLAESQQRIKSMSLIHENLYQSDNLLEIDFEDYIKMLANRLCRFYTVPNVAVKLNIQVEDVRLDIETAVPCGLIINELISNSLKHAFDGSAPTGTISVRFTREGCSYRLVISDNGIGLPKDLDLSKSASMGMEIVSILTKQLEGNLIYGGTEGARFEITFPMSEKQAA